MIAHRFAPMLWRFISNLSPQPTLLAEINRIEKHHIYQKQVFFIENLGFCEPTAARKISFEESLKFEKIHLDTYAKFGYKCIKIPPASVNDRVNMIYEHVPEAENWK